MEGPIWSLEQKFSRYSGAHSFKFGGRFVHNGGGRTNPESPAVTYNTLADLLANTPSRVQITFGNGLYNGNNWELGFFAQDDWRVNRKLVLNLGLRYDFFSKMVAKSRVEGSEYGFYNLDGLLDSNFNFGPQRSPDDPYNSDGWVNLGPRFGFSYDPTGGGNTVVRGGFSVMFSPFVGGMIKQAVGSRTVPFRSIFSKLEAEQAGLRFPIYADQARAYLEGKNQPAIFSVFNPDIQNPYTVNVYLGVQRSLTSTWYSKQRSSEIAASSIRYIASSTKWTACPECGQICRLARAITWTTRRTRCTHPGSLLCANDSPWAHSQR